MLCARPLVVGRTMHHSSLEPPSWKIQVQYGAMVQFFKSILLVGHRMSNRVQTVPAALS